VTPDSKIYCEKVKLCRFSSGNWSPNSCGLPCLVKVATQLCTSKKSVINWTWLRLSISDWSIIIIGPGGLLLVVPTYMQFQLQFYRWGCQKKNTAKLRHLILYPEWHTEHRWRCSSGFETLIIITCKLQYLKIIARNCCQKTIPIHPRTFWNPEYDETLPNWNRIEQGQSSATSL